MPHLGGFTPLSSLYSLLQPKFPVASCTHIMLFIVYLVLVPSSSLSSPSGSTISRVKGFSTHCYTFPGLTLPHAQSRGDGDDARGTRWIKWSKPGSERLQGKETNAEGLGQPRKLPRSGGLHFSLSALLDLFSWVCRRLCIADLCFSTARLIFLKIKRVVILPRRCSIFFLLQPNTSEVFHSLYAE